MLSAAKSRDLKFSQKANLEHIFPGENPLPEKEAGVSLGKEMFTVSSNGLVGPGQHSAPPLPSYWGSLAPHEEATERWTVPGLCLRSCLRALGPETQ